MTIELVDGRAGKPHISGEDLGDFKAGIVGNDGCVFNRGELLAATLNSANSVSIATGSGLMPLTGRHFRITEPETVAITSGTQGQNRNDLIVVRTTTAEDNTSIESASIVVLRGEPTTGVAADPSYEDGDLPLYRIQLSGVSVEEPIALFSVMVPYNEFRDSISLSTKEYQNCKVSKQGDFVIINGFIQTGNENKITIATLPSGFKPPLYVAAPTTSGGYAEVNSFGVFSIIPKPGTNYFALCYAV